MANATRKDPYSTHNFLAEIDGLTPAGFQEVSGLTAGVGVIEYREGGDIGSVRKIPGLRKFTDVTLKRGIVQDRSLWFNEIANGVPDRRNVSIVLLDDQRQPVNRWTLRNAWPRSGKAHH